MTNINIFISLLSLEYFYSESAILLFLYEGRIGFPVLPYAQAMSA